MLFFELLALIGIVSGQTSRIFGSSSVAVLGEKFELTCISTAVIFAWRNTTRFLAFIHGDKSNGSCVFEGSYRTEFNYSCDSSIYTFKLTIPGKLVTQELNGSIWRCDNIVGAETSSFYLKVIYPRVQVTVLPRSKIYVAKETSLTLKCICSVRQSWQGTVFYSNILGAVATYNTSISGSCDVIITRNLYRGTCNITTNEFLLELVKTFSWFNGDAIRCVSQYGTGNKTNDLFVEASSTIEIRENMYLTVEPELIYFDSNQSVTLTCFLNKQNGSIYWWKNEEHIHTTTIKQESGYEKYELSTKYNLKIKYEPFSRMTTLVIPPESVLIGLFDTQWTCSSTIDGKRSNSVYFQVKDLPKLDAPEQNVCNQSDDVILNCTLSRESFNPQSTGVWYHIFNGHTVRTLEGHFLERSFVLKLHFCSYKDMGEYICEMTTGLIGLSTINATSKLTIAGPPIILTRSTSKSGTFITITVKYYSNPISSQPVWLLENRTIIDGPMYSTETTSSKVPINIYSQTEQVDGFISSLKIVNDTFETADMYTFNVKNVYGFAEEIFDMNTIGKVSTRENVGVKSCSVSQISGMVTGSIFGTIFVMVLLQIVVRKILRMRKCVKIMMSLE